MVWCGVVWCGGGSHGVVWCGVALGGVVWCGVVWCGIVSLAASLGWGMLRDESSWEHVPTARWWASCQVLVSCVLWFLV